MSHARIKKALEMIKLAFLWIFYTLRTDSRPDFIVRVSLTALLPVKKSGKNVLAKNLSIATEAYDLRAAEFFLKFLTREFNNT